MRRKGGTAGLLQEASGKEVGGKGTTALEAKEASRQLYFMLMGENTNGRWRKGNESERRRRRRNM